MVFRGVTVLAAGKGMKPRRMSTVYIPPVVPLQCLHEAGQDCAYRGAHGKTANQLIPFPLHTRSSSRSPRITSLGSRGGVSAAKVHKIKKIYEYIAGHHLSFLQEPLNLANLQIS